MATYLHAAEKTNIEPAEQNKQINQLTIYSAMMCDHITLFQMSNDFTIAG
jgi:hypothetical protein